MTKYLRVNEKTQILIKPRTGETETQFIERMHKKYGSTLTLDGTKDSGQTVKGFRNKELK